MADAAFTRRAMLRAIPAATIAGAIPAGAMAAGATTKPEPEDLTRYYAFLWCEFKALSDEMGVDICDSFTAHKNGDVCAVKEHLTSPPSSRASAALAAIGIDRESVKSEPSLPSRWRAS